MQQHIVFVWAWWAWVSSLVLLFLQLWFKQLIAIDSNESELTRKIAAAWCKVIIWHGQYTIQQDDIVIYSDAAMHSPEVLAAKEKVMNVKRRIFPPMSYFQFLGEISKYMCTVSIAGTHGKSTTTWFTATALYAHHPDFWLGIVGAPINQRWHTNYIIWDEREDDIRAILEHILFPKSLDISWIMKKYFFVIEADEYNHHFLHLDTDYACITNIELDHADVYGTFENYMETFLTFATWVRYDIILIEDSLWCKAFTNAYTKDNIIIAPREKFTFTHMLGTHNHMNASLALACTSHLCTKVRMRRDASLQDVTSTLSRFQWLRRRWELLTHTTKNIPLISDYAHHPSEVESTLAALREKYPTSLITCIFQPHQARRVIEFYDLFIATLSTADTCIIYDIYAAREDLETLKKDAWTRFTHIQSIDDLWETFATACWWMYTNSFDTITQIIKDTDKWIIVICTAGNLDWKVRKWLG